jgi:tetratricopeptide (TPR) repeat protein
MEKKEFGQVPASIRTAYQKAQEAIRKNNTDYAVSLLKGIVQKEPGLADARKALREQERVKASQMSPVAKIIASVKINFAVLKGKSLLKKDPAGALAAAEEALAMFLNSPAALGLLADAAWELEAFDIGIEALEIIRELSPSNVSNLKLLASFYEAAGQGLQVLTTWKKISELKPGDLEVQQSLRSAAALASMQKGKWEEEGNFQSKLKNKDEAKKLEQEDRIVRDAGDIAEMISRLEKQLEEGDDSLDVLRKLGELYQNSNKHDQAVNVLNRMVKKMGALDPTVDRAIEKSMLAKFKADADRLTQTGAPAEHIQKIEEKAAAYKLERAVDRVNKYPNDLQLRYDLAIVYWDGGHVDEALEQFQTAQRNPQRRLSCIVYLGRCFHTKGQLDMAVEQLQRATTEMLVMDKAKMEALYYLGRVYEDSAKDQEALACYKQIYQANINYLDVAKRIERFYGNAQAK